MKIAVPTERRRGEQRVALVPESCKRLLAAGVEVAIEAGAGAAASFPDAAYEKVGVAIRSERTRLTQRPPAAKTRGSDPSIETCR